MENFSKFLTIVGIMLIAMLLVSQYTSVVSQFKDFQVVLMERVDELFNGMNSELDDINNAYDSSHDLENKIKE